MQPSEFESKAKNEAIANLATMAGRSADDPIVLDDDPEIQFQARKSFAWNTHRPRRR